MKRIFVAITGASGAMLGIRLLEVLADTDTEVHLVISQAGRQTITIETAYTIDEVEELADYVHGEHDMASVLASGSFPIDGMLVVPCSVKTLAGIASGYASSLILRAADVALKERRPLVLAVRETPLSLIHLENMTKVTQAGAIVMPPVPAFYAKPQSVKDICDQFVGRVLARFDITIPGYRPWTGE